MDKISLTIAYLLLRVAKLTDNTTKWLIKVSKKIANIDNRDALQ